MSANDKQIEQYRQTVETKRTELGTEPRPAYATNQLIQLDPFDSKKLNLNLLNSVEKCVETVRLIMLQAQAQDAANQALGTNIQLKIGGYTTDEWIGDIKSRLEVIEWKAEKVKLDAMDKKLSELLSEDAKKAKAIEDIAGELGLNG